MAVRTKRLFGPTTVTAAAATVYTCPAGKTALLKLLTLSGQGSDAPIIRVFINGSGVANRIARIPTDASVSSTWSEMFLVLHPGDTLVMNASVASNTTVSGHGAELDGVAE